MLNIIPSTSLVTFLQIDCNQSNQSNPTTYCNYEAPGLVLVFYQDLAV